MCFRKLTVTATEINRFREIVAVYCENYHKPVNKSCGQNAVPPLLEA
jgi:hypothetical protein